MSTKRSGHSGISFISMILILTALVLFASSMHIWFVVPNETALQINGKKTEITPEHLLGTILETTLKDE